MDLTVCICTHNRPGYVRDCLDGLRHQTADARVYEVLVVDSGSSAAAAADLRDIVALYANVRLIRVDTPGVSLARNTAARAAATGTVAFIDDDAIPAPDWVAGIVQALAEGAPSVIGGRILPRWEAPLPTWWPPSLRGVLSIIEHEGQGEYRTADLPRGMEPYAANMVIRTDALLSAGGFGGGLGRHGTALLSDEEVQLAWRLQDAGHSVRYDSRIVVHHQIQATRLRPGWLLSRLFWQGASTVLTRRMLGYGHSVWRELPRRLAVAVLFAPVALLPRTSTRLLEPRWRLAYAVGFIGAALGWRAGAAAMRRGRA